MSYNKFKYNNKNKLYKIQVLTRIFMKTKRIVTIYLTLYV